LGSDIIILRKLKRDNPKKTTRISSNGERLLNIKRILGDEKIKSDQALN